MRESKPKLEVPMLTVLEEATWEETEKEVAGKGWMEVDLEGGKDAAWAMRCWIAATAFDKVHVIDDFSIAGVNHTACASQNG